MLTYRIAVNFRGRKLSRIARFCHAKGRHAPNFVEKTFAYIYISTKPRNSQKFSPSKVFRYTVCIYSTKCTVHYISNSNDTLSFVLHLQTMKEFEYLFPKIHLLLTEPIHRSLAGLLNLSYHHLQRNFHIK